ncbi:MAG: hypothetical protein JSU98_17125 [Gemmatimonadales bacterium]|jgi:quinoprotein glucose dehydrogenase|nr:MAG: hypothetical protein JSU98_17125 [Gemmatimonadales bacterium]
MRPVHWTDATVFALTLIGLLLFACTPERTDGVDVSDSASPSGDDPAALVSDGDWPHYGRDAGGSRYSPLDQINTDNVHGLELAWTYQSGDMGHDDGSEGSEEGCGNCHTGEVKFEATPILVDDRLFLSTPLNRVVALDPATG